MKLPSVSRPLLIHYLVTVGLLLGAGAGALYVFLRWSGERELDTALRKEIELVAGMIQLSFNGPDIDNQDNLNRVRLDHRATIWQVVLEDGRALGWSKGAPPVTRGLPAIGGKDLPLEELLFADAGDAMPGMRAARLLTVRKRENQDRPSRRSRRPPGPSQMTFDVRVVMDRTALDEQLARVRWALFGGAPLLLALAGVGGIFLIRRAVRPVEQAFERERHFTGAASHELRTPLTGLRGEIEVTLRRTRAPEEYIAALERMDVLVGRMTGLVEGLLILARNNAGHLLLGTAEVSLSALRGAIDELIGLLRGRERVTLTCTAPAERTISGDCFLLAVAVRNLVENALVHAPASQVRIDLSAHEGGLRLTVDDQGPGCPPDVLASIRQHYSARSPGANGSQPAGLGLGIARAVVESHGGRLALENNAEGGCRATVTLPATPI